jgi:hypothetical protein
MLCAISHGFRLSLQEESWLHQVTREGFARAKETVSRGEDISEGSTISQVLQTVLLLVRLLVELTTTQDGSKPSS